MSQSYEELKIKLQALQAAGQLQKGLTPAERADWAYGNTKVENQDVTREMAEQAVARKNSDG